MTAWDDDDDWDEEVTVSAMVGSAQAAGSVMEEGDDPLDLQWKALYVPDMTVQTGWSVHRVRDRAPVRESRVRRIGFRATRLRR